MTPNAIAYGPDRAVFRDLVCTFLKDSERWRDVQAACIASYVCDGLPVPASHVSEYKAARENCHRLSELLLSLLSPSSASDSPQQP